MAHTLIDKLIKGARNTILIALASSMIGCSECRPSIPNSPPYITTFNVSPTSGNVPLKVNIQFEGKDPDGEEDIIEYKLIIDREGTSNDEIIIQSHPINIDRIFDKEEDVEIHGFITDVPGATADTTQIKVKVFEEIHPNYKPEVDLSSVNIDLLEETERTIPLPAPQDLNPKDNPVPYISAISLDGKVTSTLIGDVSNGYKLIVKGIIDATGYSKTELEFGSDEGRKNTAILEWIITNLADVSGTLKENETDTPQAGVFRVYDSDDMTTPLTTNKSDASGNNFTDNVGNYKFQLDKFVSEITLQARLDIESYIRTIRFSGDKDYSGPIKIVPYPSGELSSVSPEDFREFMDRKGNPPVGINFGYGGLLKWNFLEFSGIEEIFNEISIVEKNSDTDPEMTFPVEYDEEEEWIDYINTYNIAGFVDGRELPVGWYLTNDDVGSYVGKIVVIPDSTIEDNLGNPVAGVTRPIDGNHNGYVGLVEIRLNPNYLTPHVISHELGHAFLALRGEAGEILPYNLTIIRQGSPLEKPGPADIKAASIIYEPTYLGGERLDDILGMEWMN